MITRLFLLMLVCSCARAQLVPDHLYYGVNRRMAMQVALPDDGAASIRLFRAGENEPLSEAAVEAGSVDLAALF
ncbi:MAG: hypothetical protein KDA28_15540, partial [Phycisphaerales bacterium]|nr:hypothetical protein [Phycisphaerales bacterium]